MSGFDRELLTPHPLAAATYARTKAEHELREHVRRAIAAIDDDTLPIYEQTVRSLRRRAWWRDAAPALLGITIAVVAVASMLLWGGGR